MPFVKRFIIALLATLIVVTPPTVAAGVVLNPLSEQCLGRQDDMVLVAVVDTGIDANHPALEPFLQRDQNGNVVGYDAVSGKQNMRDNNGHGTHVSGVITQLAGEFSRIMPVRAADSSGITNAKAISKAIRWAADNQARIINVSLGVSEYDQELANAVHYAWLKGSLVVAAAGNSGKDQEIYPAGNVFAIGVGVSNSSGQVLSISNLGYHVRVVAPGEQVMAATPTYTTKYSSTGQLRLISDRLTGSSQAAAYVTAQLAWLVHRCPNLDNVDLATLLQSGALGNGEWDSGKGYGVVRFGTQPMPRQGFGGVVGQVMTAVPLRPGTRIKMGDVSVPLPPNGIFHVTNLKEGFYDIELVSNDVARTVGRIYVGGASDAFFWTQLQDTPSIATFKGGVRYLAFVRPCRTLGSVAQLYDGML